MKIVKQVPQPRTLMHKRLDLAVHFACRQMGQDYQAGKLAKARSSEVTAWANLNKSALAAGTALKDLGEALND